VTPVHPVPHPAKGHLAVRRITNRQVADAYGSSEHFVGRVLNGWLTPPARFRALVADMLGVDEVELFRDEAASIGGDR